MLPCRLALTLVLIASLAVSTSARRGETRLQARYVDATGEAMPEDFPDPDNKLNIQDEINMTPNILVTKEGYWRASYPVYDDPKEGSVVKLFDNEHAARMWVYKHTGAHQSINYPMAEGLFPANDAVGQGVQGDNPEDEGSFLQEQVRSASSVAETAGGYWRAKVPHGVGQIARLFHTQSEADKWVQSHQATAAALLQLQSLDTYVDATDEVMPEEFPDPDNKLNIQDEINLTPNILVTKEGYWRASYPNYDDPKQGSVVKLFDNENAARMWVYKATGAHESINYPMAEGLFPANDAVGKGVQGDNPEDSFLQLQARVRAASKAATQEGSGDEDWKERQAALDVRV